MRIFGALAIALAACQGDAGDASDGTGTGSTTAASTTQDPSEGTGSDDVPDSDATAGEPDTDGVSSTGDGVCDNPQACAQQSEHATAAAMEALRHDPSAMQEFLIAVPKGGDLHHHLSGSVYAETFLQWADQSGDYCVQSSNLSLSRSCGDGNDVPVPTGRRDLFLEVVRAWSMLDFVPSQNESGADHFFATFSKFGAISGAEHGRMLADVKRRAATENLLYIEPMLTSNSTARSLGEDLWAGGTFGEADFESFHSLLLGDSGFPAARARLLDDADNSEEIANAELECQSAEPKLGCDVVTRYQAYISRSGSQQGVFAQMVAAYEAAIVEPRIVGLNLVGPEDGSTAMANYDLQMEMLGYLGGYYAGDSPLRLSLHAGEITSDSVPGGYQLGVESHIRKAVEIAGASRIGHGVDVLFENDPQGLLTDLREGGVLVEICLASNDIILEVTGDQHPIHEYLAQGVPVSLATDDQAVARSSIAAEFFRGVMDEGLDYYELKQMSRASLQYSFLPGESLFADAETLQIDDTCAPDAGNTVATTNPDAECEAFLGANDRARVQFDLEVRMLQFESQY